MQCLQVVRAIAIANMELQNCTFVAIYYTFQQYNTGSAIEKVRWKMWFLGETRQVLRGYSQSNPSISQWGPEQTMAREIWFPGLYFLKELIQCKVYSTMLIFCLHKLCLSRFIPRSFINYVADLNGQIYQLKCRLQSQQCTQEMADPAQSTTLVSPTTSGREILQQSLRYDVIST